MENNTSRRVSWAASVEDKGKDKNPKAKQLIEILNSRDTDALKKLIPSIVSLRSLLKDIRGPEQHRSLPCPLPIFSVSAPVADSENAALANELRDRVIQFILNNIESFGYLFEKGNLLTFIKTFSSSSNLIMSHILVSQNAPELIPSIDEFQFLYKVIPNQQKDFYLGLILTNELLFKQLVQSEQDAKKLIELFPNQAEYIYEALARIKFQPDTPLHEDSNTLKLRL